MDKLNALVNKFSKLPIKDFLREAIQENKEQIEDKNAEQMNRGEYPDGSRITPPYKEITKRIKAAIGQPFDRVTLKDTGDFHKGITINMDSDSFTIDGKDPKTEELVYKYGDVFGLSDQSKEEIQNDILKPELLDKFKKYLNVQ